MTKNWQKNKLRVYDRSDELSDIASLIKDSGSFILVPHIGLDGDDLGSMLALRRALQLLGKKIFLYSAEPVPYQLTSISGIEYVSSDVPKEKFDCMVTMECTNASRIPGKIKPSELSRLVINLDHHRGNAMEAHFHYVDEKASSLGEIIFCLLKSMDVVFDKKIAEALYLAIVSDTGCFKYSNTSQKTLSIASELLSFDINSTLITTRLFSEDPINLVRLKGYLMNNLHSEADGKLIWVTITRDMMYKYSLELQDLQKMPEDLNIVKSSLVLAIFTETESNKFKVSLRSKFDAISVRSVALKHKGGGHEAAAGCSIEGEGCVELLIAELLNLL